LDQNRQHTVDFEVERREWSDRVDGLKKQLYEETQRRIDVETKAASLMKQLDEGSEAYVIQLY
jgi:hypothetical protein